MIGSIVVYQLKPSSDHRYRSYHKQNIAKYLHSPPAPPTTILSLKIYIRYQPLFSGTLAFLPYHLNCIETHWLHGYEKKLPICTFLHSLHVLPLPSSQSYPGLLNEKQLFSQKFEIQIQYCFGPNWEGFFHPSKKGREWLWLHIWLFRKSKVPRTIDQEDPSCDQNGPDKPNLLLGKHKF